MKAAVLGATGYTGMVLLRLLDKHPNVEHILPISSSRAQDPLDGADPGLDSAGPRFTLCGSRYLSLEEALRLRPDVVFSALPHGESARTARAFLPGSVVIDLSADLRHRDPTMFERAYGHPPPEPDLILRAAYGLAEWETDAVRRSDLIANPGCYPTSVLLPLLPLYREGVITGLAVINSISGISGAGRKSQAHLLYAERTENTGAYSPGRQHRHSYEMEEKLAQVQPGARLVFQPHLAPLKRGMATTIAVSLAPGKTAEDACQVWERQYGSRPCIRLRTTPPQTQEVWGSNRCDIHATEAEGQLLVFSVIDNLMKGASGQAVQNMNLRFGFEESAGLPLSNQV